jgi:uncharacterized protein YeaO (DUF488 family)
MELRAKCVRDAVGLEDGERLLVTRFRPQGLAESSYDGWDKRLAPSVLLTLAWRNRWITRREFASLYVGEMRAQAPNLRELGERASVHPVTLLCQCADSRRCHVDLLRALVERMFRARPRALAAAP